MRSLRIALAALVLFASILAAAESAKSLYKKAADAEARQDYEAAYELYKAAYEKEPKDLKYRVPYQRMRFMAAASKIKRAQKLREQGKLQEALELFLRAAEIDPSNDLAVQELRRTQRLIQGQQAPAGGDQPQEPRPPKTEDVLRQRLERARSPVELAQLSDVPITGLKMTNEDSKVVYDTLGKLAGINVLFDPDYQSKRIPVDLQHVTLREALDIVAMESRTFWRPVTPNTIFVAQDTLTKRKEIEQNVIKTFYLGNSGGGTTANTDLQDVVTTIRTILEVTRIQVVPSQNAIIMKGTPDQIALAQKIIDDLDKVKPEVVVEVVVAQISHTKTRDLGILPPQHASVALQGTTTPASGTTPASSALDFFNLERLTEHNFAVTNLDPLTAKLLVSGSDSKVLQSPQIRSTDNEKGSLKITTKIPSATGSFGLPAGITGSASVGVNTQFNFIDVGIIMEITPHVHPDGEVTLKISLELSSQTDTRNIGGIDQPIVGTKKVEGTLRLRDGEVNLISGILENTETKSNTGMPLLSSIPILKYFFSQEHKELDTNELVFLLIPHIVRGQELSDLNRRAIDVGTQSGIELRMANVQPVKPQSEQQTGSVAPQAPPQIIPPVPIQQQAVPASSGQPPATPPVATSPADTTPRDRPSAAFSADSGTASFRLSPPNQSPAQGTTFALDVTLANARDVHSVPLQVTYDPNVMQFVSVSNGGFLSKDGQNVALVNRPDPTTGTLQVMAQRPPGTAGISGEGTVFSLVFMAKAKGSGVVSITIPGARNSKGQPIQALGSQAAVTVN